VATIHLDLVNKRPRRGADHLIKAVKYPLGLVACSCEWEQHTPHLDDGKPDYAGIQSAFREHRLEQLGIETRSHDKR
jgi:hypothetical protein